MMILKISARNRFAGTVEKVEAIVKATGVMVAKD